MFSLGYERDRDTPVLKGADDEEKAGLLLKAKELDVSTNSQILNISNILKYFISSCKIDPWRSQGFETK